MLDVDRPQQRARYPVERKLPVGVLDERVGRGMERRFAGEPRHQRDEHGDEHNDRESERPTGGCERSWGRRTGPVTRLRSHQPERPTSAGLVPHRPMYFLHLFSRLNPYEGQGMDMNRLLESLERNRTKVFERERLAD